MAMTIDTTKIMIFSFSNCLVLCMNGGTQQARCILNVDRPGHPKKMAGASDCRCIPFGAGDLAIRKRWMAS